LENRGSTFIVHKLHKLYYNGKAARYRQCCVTCIFTLANAAFYLLLVSLPGGRSSSWVPISSYLGISMIPIEICCIHTHTKYIHTHVKCLANVCVLLNCNGLFLKSNFLPPFLPLEPFLLPRTFLIELVLHQLNLASSSLVAPDLLFQLLQVKGNACSLSHIGKCGGFFLSPRLSLLS